MLNVRDRHNQNKIVYRFTNTMEGSVRVEVVELSGTEVERHWS